jgi:hypothetical protein
MIGTMSDWKIRTLFGLLNDANAKFYNPAEHLAVKVTVLFKGKNLLGKRQAKFNTDEDSYTCNSEKSD